MATSEQLTRTEPATWHKGECDEIILKTLIEKHFKHTGSDKARKILDRWDDSRLKFVKVFPSEYKRALGEMHAAKAKQAKAKESQKA